MSARKSSARFAWSRFIEGPYDTAVPGEHRRHGGQMIGGAPTQIYASTSPLSRSATVQTVTHHWKAALARRITNEAGNGRCARWFAKPSSTHTAAYAHARSLQSVRRIIGSDSCRVIDDWVKTRRRFCRVHA